MGALGCVCVRLSVCFFVCVCVRVISWLFLCVHIHTRMWTSEPASSPRPAEFGLVTTPPPLPSLLSSFVGLNHCAIPAALCMQKKVVL